MTRSRPSPSSPAKHRSSWQIWAFFAAVVALLTVSLTVEAAPTQGAAAASAVMRGASGAGVGEQYAPPPDSVPLAPGAERVEAPAGFNSYDGGWIRFEYPPEIRQRVQPLIASADEFRAELRRRLQQPVLDHVVVYVARSAEEMVTLIPGGARAPSYASGLAFSELDLVLLTIHPKYPGTKHDLAEVFRHELAHIAISDAVGGARVPRWFNEGLAVHLSAESQLDRMETLWTATLSDSLIPLDELDRSFPDDSVETSIAYAQSADLVRYMLRTEDAERFGSLLRRIGDGQTFEGALSDAYGSTLELLEYDWRAEVAKRYSFWPVFFGGSTIWVGALVLFFMGWRKKRRVAKVTLDRWAHEEALEDARRAGVTDVRSSEQRVHIMFQPQATGALPPNLPPPGAESGVPKVEHDGSWHTLH